MKYHFLYKEKREDFYSKGVTIHAQTLKEAFEIFESEYIGVIFIGLYCIDELLKDDNG